MQCGPKLKKENKYANKYCCFNSGRYRTEGFWYNKDRVFSRHFNNHPAKRRGLGPAQSNGVMQAGQC
jgi:hypothetical protein